MKKLVVLLALVLIFTGTNANSFFMRLNPVTTYTDNTAIEPAIGVFIDAWVDNVLLATMAPSVAPFTYIPLIDNTFGATHVYKARTHLSDGRLSADYIVTLTSPLDSRLPNPPGAASSPATIVNTKP